MLDKSPPSDLNAEKNILSCIFISPEILNESRLKPQHFYSKEYSDIFKAMKLIQASGGVVDTISVNGKTKDNIDMDMLYDIYSFSLTSNNREASELLVIENYNRRSLIKRCTSVIQNAYMKEKDIGGTLFDASRLTDEIEILETQSTMVAGAWNTMEKYFISKESPVILKDMGYKFLSGHLLGWRAGALYILAGGTGQGKSTLALNLCIEALKRGVQCAFFSTEMPAHEIHTRFVSRETKIPAWKIEKGHDSIADKVLESTQLITKRDGECNIYDSFRTVENLESLISKEASLGTKIIFIDYIQQVKVPGFNRNLGLGDMTTMLKHMAIRYGIAIVGLSQLNRASQDSTDGPKLRDLRDSGSIEQDADVVMMVRGFDEDGAPPDIGIRIAKNRHGEQGDFRLGFDKRYFLFHDL